MKQDTRQGLGKMDLEQILMVCFLIAIAIYYGIHMFMQIPWYDELYTYYYFISRGPVYAAIHWPLPNNHVGYSVLSAFLDLFGNSYIGLRGVSFIASLGSLYLLYRIGEVLCPKGLRLALPFLYSSMWLTNNLAIQGRGYAFTTCMMLLAIRAFLSIAQLKESSKSLPWYFVWSISLILALYAIPSCVYWVIPLCMACGIYLLKKQQIRQLIQLILWSVVAAFGTFFLYTIIWLAIGSNLLTKDAGNPLFGISHTRIILHHPIQAASAGIEYMLATPYIQSVSREGFLGNLWNYLKTLCEYQFSDMGIWVIVVSLLGILLAILSLLFGIDRMPENLIFQCILCTTMLVMMPFLLLVQCKLPYYRVFSYYGIFTAWIVILLLQLLFWGPYRTRFYTGFTAVAIFYTATMLMSSSYNEPLGARETEIAEAFDSIELEQKNICVTDCNQQYLLKFLYDIICENQDMANADIILFDKELLDPDGTPSWEAYIDYSQIDQTQLSKMTVSYETENYILYTKE